MLFIESDGTAGDGWFIHDGSYGERRLGFLRGDSCQENRGAREQGREFSYGLKESGHGGSLGSRRFFRTKKTPRTLPEDGWKGQRGSHAAAANFSELQRPYFAGCERPAISASMLTTLPALRRKLLGFLMPHSTYGTSNFAVPFQVSPVSSACTSAAILWSVP